MQIKDGNRKTGQGRIVCPFYEEVDSILGTRAASAPPTLLESSGISDDPGIADDNSEFITGFMSVGLARVPPPPPKIIIKFGTRYLPFLEENPKVDIYVKMCYFTCFVHLFAGDSLEHGAAASSAAESKH